MQLCNKIYIQHSLGRNVGEIIFYFSRTNRRWLLPKNKCLMDVTEFLHRFVIL